MIYWVNGVVTGALLNTGSWIDVNCVVRADVPNCSGSLKNNN